MARKQADKKKPRRGRLRIVAGNWRSRLLEIADVPSLRPTSERIRETLFNWLSSSSSIDAWCCLDLCAGTGALGLEALSRGAAHAVFVEKSADATAALTKNVRTLGASNAEVLNMDALAYLSSGRAEKFDLVFLDPPFSSDLYGELCRLLSNGGWLADGARIYIEMDRAQSDSFMPDDWQVLKDKSAGNVRYMLATRIDKGSPDT